MLLIKMLKRKRSKEIIGYIVLFIVIGIIVYIWLEDIAPNLQYGFVGAGDLWSGYNLTEEANIFINEHQEFFILLFVILCIIFFLLTYFIFIH